MFNLEILPNINRKFGRESGQALVAALAAITVLTLIAVAVLTLAIGQMSITAHDNKSLQAFNIAEAGVNRALWEIENNLTYSGTTDPVSFQGGSYMVTVTSSSESGRQYRVVDSTGTYPQTGRQVSRKIRVRVEVVPKALTHAVFASFNIFAAGATKETFLAPLDWHVPGAKGGDLGSNKDIVFQDRALRLNYRDKAQPTTYDNLFGPQNPPTTPVPRGNIVVKGQVKGPAGEVYTDINDLKADFKYLDMAAIIPLASEIILPQLNFSTYETMARNNTSPGEGAADGYFDNTLNEFQNLFAGKKEVVLSGMIYVNGSASIPQNQALRITKGGLVVKGDVTIANNSSLIIAHDSNTKYYPGLFSYSVADGFPPAETGSVITINGTLDVQGLIYAERMIIWSGYARVKGGVIVSSCQDQKGYENQNSTIVLQYDPDVQNVMGVKPPSETITYSLAVKQIVSWREVAAP